jgi:hypothetical protein
MRSFRIFHVVAMSMAVLGTQAQQLDWVWVQNGGAPENAVVNASDVDADGNTFVTGEFRGLMQLGDISLVSNAYYSGFIGKLGPNGDWLWARSFESTDYWKSVLSKGLVIASDGSAYITGSFQGTTYFGGLSLTAVGFEKAFVARITAEGDWSWVSVPACLSPLDGSQCESVALNGQGDLFVGGNMMCTCLVGADTVNTMGTSGRFIARLNTAGEWQWIRPVVAEHLVFRDIATTPDGGVVMVGSVQGMAVFAQDTFITGGHYKACVLKWDAEGNEIWLRKTGGSLSMLGSSVDVDASGRIYATASMWGPGEAVLGDTIVTVEQANGFSIDGCVVRLEANGHFSWIRCMNGPGMEFPQSVDVLPNGDLVVAGYYGLDSCRFGSVSWPAIGSDGFIVSLSGEGDWLDAYRHVGPGYDEFLSVSAGIDGSIVACGSSTSGIFISPPHDLLIAKLAPISTSEADEYPDQHPLSIIQQGDAWIVKGLSDGPVEVMLLDVAGRSIARYRGVSTAGGCTFASEALPSGVWLFSVSQGEREQVLKYVMP